MTVDTINEEVRSNNIQRIHHLEFHVGNAMHSAFWYCFYFGFKRFAHLRYKGIVHIAVRNGPIILVFKALSSSTCDKRLYSKHEYAQHGDFVKEVCFEVDDIDEIVRTLKKHNCETCMEPTVDVDSENNGTIRIAKIKSAAGDIVHSLIKNINYNGIFLPHYKPINNFKFLQNLEPITFSALDHIVENHHSGGVLNASDFYKKTLGLIKFWTVDDSVTRARYGAIKAVLVGTDNRKVQMVLGEPGDIVIEENDDYHYCNQITMKGQIEEFLDSNAGPGIQHIAFHTNDICHVVQQLHDRGVEFLSFKSEYYVELRKRLATSKFLISENLDTIEKFNILIDFDENGYLLQIFTKPMSDRPSLFIEIIQRHNFVGFGAGNFKALFLAVEEEQIRRQTEFKDQIVSDVELNGWKH